jgi:hypothetical protein
MKKAIFIVIEEDKQHIDLVDVDNYEAYLTLISVAATLLASGEKEKAKNALENQEEKENDE